MLRTKTVRNVVVKPVTKVKNALEDNAKILDRYRQHCKNKGLTHESIKAACSVDIPMFLRFIGNKRLQDVTHLDIEDFMAYCADVRKNKPQSIARKYTSINSFFKAIIKQELAPVIKNPCDKVDKPKSRKKVRPYLTIDEYKKILEYVDSIGDLRGGAVISFYFSSACRLTEGWQQNRDSLNFQTRRFKVLGKGEKERTCVFSEDAMERVLRYLDSRTDDCEALFISREGTRWSKRALQKYVKDIGLKAGITKNVHPHLFRHTRAMALLKAGVQLQEIQKLLGHESIATTQVYAHCDMDDVQGTVDKIDLNI